MDRMDDQAEPKRKKPREPRKLAGTAVGIGSAAIVAAMLYTSARKKRRRER